MLQPASLSITFAYLQQSDYSAALFFKNNFFNQVLSGNQEIMTVDLSLPHLWQHLGWPLTRLLIYLSIGLLVALFIESLNWTKKIAAVAQPLTRFAHLPTLVAASFSMCFFSGIAANTMLAEGYNGKVINRKELILANLFNSLPSNILHLPTTFFILAPIIKGAAFVYLGLTVGAAIFRTLVVALIARMLLPACATLTAQTPSPENPHPFRSAWRNTIKRFRKRIRRIAGYTVPIYILFYFLNEAGFFTRTELYMTEHLSWLGWLSPEAISILSFQVVAEFTAGVAAAGALLASGSMQQHEVVLVLLAGNVLSSPVRALRHQYPYYAGIFKPVLAGQLLFIGQGFRALSILAAMLFYYWLIT